MDIILSFLAKPVDKHCITLVHITYLPLLFVTLSEHKIVKPIVYFIKKDRAIIRFSFLHTLLTARPILKIMQYSAILV